MPGTIPNSSVLEFYNDAKIFLTGATGFLGKTLIEKLLRSCPSVNHIYILVRTKKGKDPQERLKDLFEDPIFEVIRKEKPDFEKKITCIPGDVSFENLNMNENDYEFLVNEVTHVFHSAATVRFNEKLKTAIGINVLGTQEILKFCNKCTRLKIFVHISTAYSHCVREEVGEEYYDPPLTANQALDLVKTLSEEKLESVTEELIKPWPNTYSYTKSIGEDIVKKNTNSIPALIFRPGIVMGTYKEPVEGWIDNIYGPTGIIAAIGVGLLRVILADDTTQANILPVDLTVNAVLACAWEVGSNFNNNSAIENSRTDSEDGTEVCKKASTEPEIYNFVIDKNNAITWSEFKKIILEHGVTIPTTKSIWCYTLTTTKFRPLFLFYTFLYHIIPGVLGDGILILLRKKPQFLRAYKKIYTFTDLMSIFAIKHWKFRNDNLKRLSSRLSDADKALFYFDVSEIDWQQYLYRVAMGIRLYILKDPMETLPSAKRKMFIFQFLHRAFQWLTVVFALWILSKLFVSFFDLSTQFREPTLTQSGLLTNST